MTRTSNGKMVPHTVLTMDIVSLRARAVTAEDWETVELCDAALGRPSAFYVHYIAPGTEEQISADRVSRRLTQK